MKLRFVKLQVSEIKKIAVRIKQIQQEFLPQIEELSLKWRIYFAHAIVSSSLYGKVPAKELCEAVAGEVGNIKGRTLENWVSAYNQNFVPLLKQAVREHPKWGDEAVLEEAAKEAYSKFGSWRLLRGAENHPLGDCEHEPEEITRCRKCKKVLGLEEQLKEILK